MTLGADRTAARSAARTRPGRLSSLGAHLLVAAATYTPLLLTAPGRVAADTKTYLYLDPSRLIARAPYMWDPNVGLGTVTHQTIGYLFPIGPWYWAFEAMGVPDWVAQRLWVATVMFAAGAGVLYLLRTLGWRLPAAVPAALVYALSPYVLHYAARISVILLPWAALPWMVALTQRAIVRGGWRHPALFALVAMTAGSVNATALVFAGLGPVLWLVFAVWSHREATVRRAVGTALRIGLLTTLCSLWWISGLAVQSGWGIDILRYTETVETVARTSLSSEVLRGLGYWFFYGGDKLGPWIEPGRDYTQLLWLIAVGFTIPILAVLAAVGVRWRYRAYFIVILLVGAAIAVGSHPYDAPSPAGALFKEFTGSSAGLALRSTPRALPLVVLGLSVLLGAGVSALLARARPAGVTAGLVVAGLAIAGIPPLWTGDFIGENLQRPEEVPDYWEEAAAWLDGRDHATRVLEIPGADFASYRWGNTVDPITPGLMDRPYAARELIPWGSPPSADLMIALDRRMQEGVFDPDALAPIARILGVGDVVLRADLQYERYRTARPRVMWNELTPRPRGFDGVVSFGEGVPNIAIARLPLLDEIQLAIPPDLPHPPAVAAFEVRDPLPIVRTHAATSPVVIAGDAEGVIDAAAAGLIDGSQLLLFSADLTSRGGLDAALDNDAVLVLTDTNRRRGRRWGTVRENAGYTETAGENPLEEDPSDNRLPVFPDAQDNAMTVAELDGVRRIAASTYGNPVSWTPEDRAANALDGDTFTAWRVGAFAPVQGERLLIELDEPVTTTDVTLVQPITGPRNRYLTRVELRFDETDSVIANLDDRSRTADGQTIDVGTRRFRTLELIVRGDNVGKRARYDGWSGVGLAEVRLPGVGVDEVLRLPRDLLKAAGERARDHPLTVLLSRARSNPGEPVRTDEEQRIARVFTLPGPRIFSVGGRARLSAVVADDFVDRFLGIPEARSGGLTARSSGRLPGSLAHRASSAFDGDPQSSWSPGFGPQEGHWLEVEVPRRLRVDHLDLRLMADRRHSLPSRIRVETDEGAVATVNVPAVAARRRENATATVPVNLRPVAGRRFRFVVESVRAVRTVDYYGERPIDMPVGIAEIGMPGVRRPDPADRIPPQCRDDLLVVDGEPVAVTVAGAPEAAVARQAMRLEACDATDLALGRGEHEIKTTVGRESGIDIDQLALRSAAGGRAAAAEPFARDRGPEINVIGSGRVSHRLKVRADGEPFWLVLGQSHNDGWRATVDGAGDLGEPRLVDGYANGWYVDPAALGVDGPDLRISLTWTPQRGVWIAIVISALAVLGCAWLIVTGRTRRRQVSAPPNPHSPELRSPFALTGTRPSSRTILLAAAGMAVIAGALTHPVLGAGIAGVTAIALIWQRGSAVLAAGSVLALAAAAGYTVVRQWRNDFPPDFGWPQFFEPSHWLAWTALALLGADLVVGALRGRAAGRSVDNSPNSQG